MPTPDPDYPSLQPTRTLPAENITAPTALADAQPRPMSTPWQLQWISSTIDESNAHRDLEAVTWGRLAKLTEEAGEVIAAYIGATGQNPRKGVTHTHYDVMKELFDVALTALAAAYHIDANYECLDPSTTVTKAFRDHIDNVFTRLRQHTDAL